MANAWGSESGNNRNQSAQTPPLPRWLKQHWQTHSAMIYPRNIDAGFPAGTRGLATVVAKLPHALNTPRRVEIIADELLKRAYPMRVAENKAGATLSES